MICVWMSSEDADQQPALSRVRSIPHCFPPAADRATPKRVKEVVSAHLFLQSWFAFLSSSGKFTSKLNDR
jgi:hypothetical protein